jgi:hypothetical protein
LPAVVGGMVVSESEPEGDFILGEKSSMLASNHDGSDCAGPGDSMRPDLSLKSTKKPAEQPAIHLCSLAVN